MCCSSLRLCVGLVDYCHQDNLSKLWPGPTYDFEHWRSLTTPWHHVVFGTVRSYRDLCTLVSVTPQASTASASLRSIGSLDHCIAYSTDPARRGLGCVLKCRHRTSSKSAIRRTYGATDKRCCIHRSTGRTSPQQEKVFGGRKIEALVRG